MDLSALTDPAAIGYPLLAGGVLLGSIIPIVPTGAVVGVAAAVAMTTGHLSLPLVMLVAAAAALAGDLVTFAVAKLGSDATVRRLTRSQTPERLASARTQFARRGWQLVVVGRLLPAGRIPVLVAAAALAYPWRRLVPAAAVACLLWALAYSVLGVVSGGLFDSPLVATLIATVLVLVVGAVSALVARRRSGRGSAPGPGSAPAGSGSADPEPADPATADRAADRVADPTPVDGRADPTRVDGRADRTPVDGRADRTPVDGRADRTPVDGRADRTPADGRADVTTPGPAPSRPANDPPGAAERAPTNRQGADP